MTRMVAWKQGAAYLSSCSNGWTPSESGSDSRGGKAPGGPASCGLEQAPSLA